MFELLKEVNILSCFVRVILALLFGGIVGMERGKKGRPAGLRTYMLVCVGSALVMITNQYMASIYPNIDPSRMGAQVISGIGFLGAGTIIITGKSRVKGLTTAAGLWAVACLGLAVGIGFYYGAIIGAICIFIVMETLHTLDDKMMAGSKVLTVYIEFYELSKIGKFMELIKQKGVYVSEMELVHQDCGKCEEKVAAIFTLTLKQKLPHSKVIEAIQQMEGVMFIEEV
ncbi:MAG: MgtC/SapB family protein [bacterium]|nr:MgtC/SapB family protein [bacterium]